MKIGGFGLLIILIIIPVASAIQITEIMYSPTTVQGGASNEWVELYNPSDRLINLDGWKLSELNNRVSSPHALPNLTLQPKEYLILARDKAKFNSYYSVNCSVIDVSFGYGLNNDGDNVSLIDSSNLSVVSVYYDGTIGKNNYSIQLSDNSWCEGIPTPGKASACREAENKSDETSAPSETLMNISQNNASQPAEEENTDESDAAVKQEYAAETSVKIPEKTEINESPKAPGGTEGKKIIYQSKNEETKSITVYLLAILLVLLVIYAIKIHKV